MTATILKKLLPHSRNVFAVILLSFVFRVVLALLALTIEWGIESVLGSAAHHAPWHGISGDLRILAVVVILYDPIVGPFGMGSMTAYLHNMLTTDPPYASVGLGVGAFSLIAFLPLCWLACCLVNRRIIFNLPQKSFWFFVVIQQYIMIGMFFGLIIISPWTERVFATFTINSILNLFSFIFIIIFPFLCWWGVERLRKKYVPETDTSAPE